MTNTILGAAKELPLLVWFNTDRDTPPDLVIRDMEWPTTGERAMSRLLLVDDEEGVLIGMRRYFRVLGFEVDCAGGADEADTLLSTGHYDAVIVDLGLTPGLGPDGLRVVRAARASLPQTRIVVLTAFGSLDLQQRAALLGADVYLQKPQSLEQLRAAVTPSPSDREAHAAGKSR